MNDTHVKGPVELLNDEVSAKAHKALSEGKKRPEFDMFKLHPVYKERSHWLAYVLLLCATYCVVSYSPGIPSLLWGFFMYMYIDFYGGLLHYALDEPSNLKDPYLKEACLEFQWHHHLPHDISSQTYVEVLGALNLLISIKWIIVIFYSAYLDATGSHDDYTRAMVTGWGCLFAALGQWSHQQAHTQAKNRTPVAKLCQEIGLIIDPKLHASHHNHAFDEPHTKEFATTYPILHGRTGWLLEACFSTIPEPTFWTMVFYLLTIFDIIVFVGTVNSVGRVLSFIFG